MPGKGYGALNLYFTDGDAIEGPHNIAEDDVSTDTTYPSIFRDNLAKAKGTPLNYMLIVLSLNRMETFPITEYCLKILMEMATRMQSLHVSLLVFLVLKVCNTYFIQ